MRKPLKWYVVRAGDGSLRTLRLTGRDAWCLDQLLDAGASGFTTLDNPAPRTSDYLYSLRKKHGHDIETKLEPHSGPFSGQHGRFILKSDVRRIASPSKEAD